DAVARALEPDRVKGEDGRVVVGDDDQRRPGIRFGLAGHWGDPSFLCFLSEDRYAGGDARRGKPTFPRLRTTDLLRLHRHGRGVRVIVESDDADGEAVDLVAGRPDAKQGALCRLQADAEEAGAG